MSSLKGKKKSTKAAAKKGEEDDNRAKEVEFDDVVGDVIVDEGSFLYKLYVNSR